MGTYGSKATGPKLTASELEKEVPRSQETGTIAIEITNEARQRIEDAIDSKEPQKTETGSAGAGDGFNSGSTYKPN